MPPATAPPHSACRWAAPRTPCLHTAPSRAPPAPTRWRCIDKWSGAARQAIHHLSFLESNPNYACASGLDSEVVCGSWALPPPPVAVKPYTVAPTEAEAAAPAAAPRGHTFSFKGDSRWLGVTKAAGADTLAGFAASGWVTYARLGVGAAAAAGPAEEK
jgi:hypothetical protein